MIDGTFYSPKDAIEELIAVNNLLKLGAAKIARFNGLQKLGNQQAGASPKEHHTIGLIAEFLFDESKQIRKYASHILRQKPDLKESTDAVSAFLHTRSEDTLYHLLDAIAVLIVESREGEYSPFLEQHGNFLGRYCTKILSCLSREDIFPDSNSSHTINQGSVLDRSLRDYVMEHQDGRILTYLKRFIDSSDPFLVRDAIQLIGVAGISNLFNDVYKKSQSSNYLIVNDAIQALVGLALQKHEMRDRVVDCISALCNYDKLIEKYQSVTEASYTPFTRANYTLNQGIIALGSLGAYEKLNEVIQGDLLPYEGNYRYHGKDRESLVYVKREIIRAFKKLYVDSQIDGKESDKCPKLLDEILSYANDSASIVREIAMSSIKQLASERSIRFLMDTPTRNNALRVPLARSLGYLFQPPEGGERDCSREFPQLRVEIELLLKDWAARRDTKRTLRIAVAKAMFLMNVQLTDADLQILKQDEPSIERWYLYREPIELLEQYANTNSDQNIRFLAETQLILSGERQWVSEGFAKQMGGPPGGKTTQLKVIPKLGEIEHESATDALARVLNAKSFGIAIAVRRSLKPYHCFNLAVNRTEEFIAELYHKDQRRVFAAYVNLLHAADEFRSHGQNLLSVLMEKQEEKQMRKSQESLISLEHKQLFEKIIRSYGKKEARILEQNPYEIYLECPSMSSDGVVLAMAPSIEGSDQTVLLARDFCDPHGLNFLGKCLSDTEIFKRIQSKILGNKGKDIVLMGRITGKTEDKFCVDIGSQHLEAYIPYDEMDFDQIGEAEAEKYIGNLTCARVMNGEDLEKQSHIHALILSRKEYLRSTVLDELENNAEIDVRIANMNYDNEEMVVEYKDHRFTLTRDQITYSPLRNWHEGLAIGSALKATVKRSSNALPTLSLLPNKPVYRDRWGISHARDIPYLIAKYGSQTFSIAYIDGTRFELLDGPPGTYCSIPPGFLFDEEGGADPDFLLPALIGRGDILTVQFRVQHATQMDTNVDELEYSIENSENSLLWTPCSQELILLLVEPIRPCEPYFEQGQVIHGIVERKLVEGRSTTLVLDLMYQALGVRVKGHLQLPLLLAETYELGDKIIARYRGYDKVSQTVRLQPIYQLRVGKIYPCLVSADSVGTDALTVRSGPFRGQIPIDKISYSLENEVTENGLRQILKANSYQLEAMLEECAIRNSPISPEQDVERAFGQDFIGDVIDTQGSRYTIVTPDGELGDFDLSVFSISPEIEPPRIGEKIEISQGSNSDYSLRIYTAMNFTLLQDIKPYEDCQTWLGSQVEHRVTYAGLKDGYHRFEMEPGKIFSVARNLIEEDSIDLSITELEVGDSVLIRMARRGIQIVEIQPSTLRRLVRDGMPIRCTVRSVLPSGGGVKLEIHDDRYSLRPHLWGIYRYSDMSDDDRARFKSGGFVGSESLVRIDRFGYDIDADAFDIEFSCAETQNLNIRSLRERWKNERPFFTNLRIAGIVQGKYDGKQFSDLRVRLEDYPDISGVVRQQEISWNSSLRRVLDTVAQMRQSGRKTRAKVKYVDIRKKEVGLSLIDSEPVEFEQFLLNEEPKGRISLAFIESNEEGELVFEFLPGIHFRIPRHLVRVQGSPFDVEYFSSDVVDAIVSDFGGRSVVGLNILHLYRPPSNMPRDRGYIHQGRYLEQRGNEWLIELSDINWYCFFKPGKGASEPQQGAIDLFIFAETTGGGKVYLRRFDPRTAGRHKSLIWVTIDKVTGNGINVKYGNDMESYIPENYLSWGRSPLTRYQGFKPGNKILCTLSFNERANKVNLSLKDNKPTYAHYFEQHRSRFLRGTSILTYYGRDNNSVYLEIEPGRNVNILFSQFRNFLDIASFRQGDMLVVYIERGKDETISLSVVSIIESQAHLIKERMLVERGHSFKNRPEFRFRDYDYLFGLCKRTEQGSANLTHQGQMLEVLGIQSHHSWGKDRCLIVKAPSSDSLMRLARLSRIEEDRIVVAVREEDNTEWYIDNREITYKVKDSDSIRKDLAKLGKEKSFLCTILNHSQRSLSLRRNHPLPFASLGNLGLDHPIELAFVETRLDDVIFEYSYGRKIAVPKALIERRNGRRIDPIQWMRYKPGDSFLVHLVDLQKDQLKLRGLRVIRIMQGPLHGLIIAPGIRQFVQASVISVSPDRITVDVFGLEVSLEKSRLLKGYQGDFANIFEELHSQSEPICVEIMGINEHGSVEARQQETDLSEILECGDIFDGKVIGHDDNAYYIGIPGNEQCSAILPITELSWQYLTSDGVVKENRGIDQPYCQFVETGQSIRVQVTDRAADAIYVSKARLMDSLMDPGYPQIVNSMGREPKGSTLDGCVKQSTGSYVLLEAYGMELLVEAGEVLWGTDSASLGPGNFVEVKITYLDKRQKTLGLSIREANKAWSEVAEHIDDVSVHSISDDGLVIEHHGSLGFVEKNELAWCHAEDIQVISDIFQEGEKVRVYRTGWGKNMKFSLISGQIQLSIFNPRDRIPKEMAKVKKIAGEGLYVSIEGLVSFISKESIEPGVYQEMQNGQEVELELVNIDEHLRVAHFQLAQEEKKSPPPQIDPSLLLRNFDRFYCSRLQNILSNLRERIRGRTNTCLFPQVFEEIRKQDISCTHSNLKLFLSQLYKLSILNEFLDFSDGYDQRECNVLLKRLLAGARLCISESRDNDTTVTSCVDDYFVAGYISLLKDNVTQSAQYLHKAYERSSNSLDIVFALAGAAGKSEDYELQEALTDRYLYMIRPENLLRLPNIYAPPKIGKEMCDFEYVEDQFGRGNVAEALSRLRDVSPSLQEAALLNMSLCHAVLGHYQEAGSILKQIGHRRNEELMSEDVYRDSYYRISLHVCLQLGDLNQFQRTLRDYINECDCSSRAAIWLAYILVWEGFYSPAYSVAKKIPNNVPESAVLRQFLANKLQEEISPDPAWFSVSESHVVDNTQSIYLLPKPDPRRAEQFFQSCLENGTLDVFEKAWQNLPDTRELGTEHLEFRAKARELSGNIGKSAMDLRTLASEVILSSRSEAEKIEILEMVLKFMADYALHTEIEELFKNQMVQDFVTTHSDRLSFDKQSLEKHDPTVIVRRLVRYWESLKRHPNGSYKVTKYAQNLRSYPKIKEIMDSEAGNPLREFISQMSTGNLKPLHSDGSEN